MASFWFATFRPSPTALLRSVAVPLAAEVKTWVVEVIAEGEERAVLLSTTNSSLGTLECRLGFANGGKSCTVWRDRGFPLMDAAITFDNGIVSVRSACFLADPAIRYDVELIRINGVTLDAQQGKALAGSFPVSYRQSQTAPDFAYPATRVRRKPVFWPTVRGQVSALDPFPVTIELERTRLPGLPPLEPVPTAVWVGIADVPPWPPGFPRSPVVSEDRADAFGVPAFRFEDMEVLGFRLDLDRRGALYDQAGQTVDEMLAEMVERLNFHRGQGQASYFRYRPATRTVVVELLRYGRMRLKEEWRPLHADDFQSQHELLVRILVGRVDDDAAQAHNPATYVPTLFVDNPWSKSLGRNMQGFDKRLADFCIRENGAVIPLRPDGRRPGIDVGEPEPLTRIAEVRLTNITGGDPGKTILEVDYPSDGDDESFDDIDLDLALGTSSFAPTRWRQSDFSDAEFRRSFARSAVPGNLAGIRTIQVSPVGEARLQQAWQQETTWITGTFVLDGDARIARPSGTIGLTLTAEPSAPGAWLALCRLLGIPEGSGRISLPAGSWYRLRCAMDFIVDDGFG
jgi:hypothetical protein